jgi:hypothetical protein
MARPDNSGWKHLIPNVGVRIELQAAITRKIRKEQVEVRRFLSQRSSEQSKRGTATDVSRLRDYSAQK